MPTFRPGDEVLVETATGEHLSKRAISSVVAGDAFDIVWVCREEEWATAQTEGREPEGVPWPANDVRPRAVPAGR
jgi:hypothetical protein